MNATEAEWIPTVQEVAGVVPAYTRGGFDDDSEEIDHAGEERGTFTETTSPTRRQVEGLISTAADEIQGRVGRSIPERCWTGARAATIWHVAADIAGGKVPAGADDARGEYATYIANFRATLDELVRQARMGPIRLV